MGEKFSVFCVRTAQKRGDNGYPIDPRYIALHPELRIPFHEYCTSIDLGNEALFLTEAQGGVLSRKTVRDASYRKLLQQLERLFEKFLTPYSEYKIHMTPNMFREVQIFNGHDRKTDQRSAEIFLFETITEINTYLKDLDHHNLFYGSEYFKGIQRKKPFLKPGFDFLTW
ncbi:hypothetical protein [Roseibium aggregatum]|uniref:Uncharacterized protein n=1 Tax=Roseibium aggregatum TaxID=187304 RepID=A0A939EFI6_9HYPH|nr:hypothetical protein [Roseibium aggregatum]MBN9672301.1 hypothetical protein [Roseibium aggregatum]